MKNLIMPALGAAFLAGLTAQPALAQQRPAATPAAPSGPAIPGIAVASLDSIAISADAKRVADTQRPITYKAQIDALQAKRLQIANQLKPLYDKIEADSKLPNPNQASLQQQAATIQRIEQAAQAELNTIAKPIAYSEQYVIEQLEAKIGDAVRAAMTKNKVSLLLSPQAVVAVGNQAYNLNQAILNELNAALPTATLVPPAGWEPRQVREQRAAEAAQNGTAPAQAPAAPRPAATPPSGR